MEMKPNQPTVEDTVSKALELIDPSGTLVPGTIEYKTIRDLILRWIDECGPDYAICMAEVGAEHLERWRNYF